MSKKHRAGEDVVKDLKQLYPEVAWMGFWPLLEVCEGRLEKHIYLTPDDRPNEKKRLEKLLDEVRWWLA